MHWKWTGARAEVDECIRAQKVDELIERENSGNLRGDKKIVTKKF